eukprot:gnl/TRDRNA2_/TRDRNA2_174460_c0_seq1.p1 gnl/TRDRNA2_/TRDRNA2_174460_c0~~gnl/TRDRNA2_/TRDRNA2_174460_c0_seq1.p1  ORF type:complete len:811 (+),score=224.30 gnl/TRDRNA2_/TRDRNA2_174460_c0_seq1:366-2435(+)
MDADMKAELAALREAAERGTRLSGKARKQLKKLEEMEERWAEYEKASGGGKEQVEDALELGSQFSATVRAGHDVKQAATMGDGIEIPEFSIQANKVFLLENARFSIRTGHRYGLMAPNGKGKTTLLKYVGSKSLQGLPESLDVLYVEQEVRASSERNAVEELLAADKRRAHLLAEEARLEKAYDAAIQAEAKAKDEEAKEAASAKVLDTNEKLIAVWDELAVLNVDAMEGQATALLIGLGFDTAKREAPTSSLSGGWRMRLALARALFLKPELLLLDEPTNHLDLDAVIWLQNYLVKEATRVTMLIVSHDQHFLNHVCTDMVMIQSRQLHYFPGDYDNYVKQHAKFLQLEEKKAAAERKEVEKLHKQLGECGTKKLSDIKKTAAKERIAEIKEKQLSQDKPYIVKFDIPGPEMELTGKLVTLSNIAFGYTEDKPIFTNLNFELTMRSRVALVGPNGCGKSTFLNLLNGDMEAKSGNRMLGSAKMRFGYYGQHLVDTLPDDMTPIQYVSNARNVIARKGTAEYQEARKQLGTKGLPGFAHELYIRDLSGGQKARVVFAGISVMKPHVLLMDEPTNHLDIESVDALITAVNDFEGGVVLISHDRRLLQETNCHLWMCKGGELGIEPLGDDFSFEDYEESILENLEEQQAAQEALAAERADKRRQRKEAAMQEAQDRKKEAEDRRTRKGRSV